MLQQKEKWDEQEGHGQKEKEELNQEIQKNRLLQQENLQLKTEVDRYCIIVIVTISLVEKVPLLLGHPSCELTCLRSSHATNYCLSLNHGLKLSENCRKIYDKVAETSFYKTLQYVMT